MWGLDPIQIFGLVIAWTLYGLLHSFLASVWLKRKVAGYWPGGMPLYRLCFNLIAGVTLLPLLYLMYYWRTDYLWQWQGGAWWLANALALFAVGGFIWSLRYYDGSEFLGLRQWRQGLRQVEDQERFSLSPLHRYVRHPWYSLALVIIWTRDMDGAFLVSSLMMTLYFALGSRLEERKLLIYHGERYARYRRLVPALIPLPWRFLTQREAQKLIEE